MTLVLVHGSASTSSLWDRVRRHLFGIPVVAPNLPGRERVEWPDGDTDRSIGAYAAWLLRALDEAGIERATVAGHSMGGAIAMWCALEHPDRVAGLGLVSSGARLRVLPAVLDGLQDGLRDVIDGMVNAQFAEGATDRDRIAWRRMVESCGAATALADLTACDRFDVMKRLGEIRVPVQILAGDADVLTPVKYARHLAEQIGASRLTVYPGAGHALPLERPDEIAGELAVLWASTAPRISGESPAAIRERGGTTASASAGRGYLPPERERLAPPGATR